MRLLTDFEIAVQIDMVLNGYNPKNLQDIRKYWEVRLS